MPKDIKDTRVDFSKEEGEVIVKKIDAILAEHNGEFVIAPLINPDGTLGAAISLFKKVELAPKAVETPNAGNGTTTTEEKTA